MENSPIINAYEIIAAEYAQVIDTRPENAYCEQPSMLSLLPSAIEGMFVLDAGCGPGQYSEWLASTGANVIAVDASSKMVHLAKTRLAETVKVKQADIRLPLDFIESNSLDIVICPLVLDYIKDWESVFREFNRVLKPRGIFIFSVEHPFRVFLLSNTERYFDTEMIEYEWSEFGTPVKMCSYKRPLQSMIMPVVLTGFLIDQIIEPFPTDECKNKSPQIYARLSKQPDFLCIRAIKCT